MVGGMAAERAREREREREREGERERERERERESESESERNQYHAVGPTGAVLECFHARLHKHVCPFSS